MDHQLRRATDERGSVLVIFAVGVPVFILLMAFVLDIGNWYAHKRQIQNQVDAAALAAGMAYGYNYPACITTPSASTAIVDAAKSYGTLNGSDVVTVNGGDDDPCQPHTPGDYASPDGTMWSEVTAKDQIPTLFGAFGLSPTISAKSRVAVMQMQSATHLRPFGVANPVYTNCAWANFDGQYVKLAPSDPESPLDWTADNALVNMSGADLHVGVVLGEGSGGGCPDQPSGPTTTYDDVGYVTGFPKGDDDARFFDLSLVQQDPGSCNPYFIPRDGATCTFKVAATISFQNCNAQHPPTVTAHVGNQTVDLTQATTCSGISWLSDDRVSVSPGMGTPAGGTIPVWLSWTNPQPPFNPVTGEPSDVQSGNFPVNASNDRVQSIMAGDDRHEGPIENFTLTQTFAPVGLFGETIRLQLAPLVREGPTTLLRGSPAGANSLSGSIACTASDPVRNGCSERFLKGAPTSAACTSTDLSCVTGADPSALTFDCSKNNWPVAPATVPDIPRGDPRLIDIAVTPVGAPFATGTSHTIVDFSAFYVTGWDGGDGCAENETKPPAATTFPGSGGAVWGHFVKFVEASSSGTPGDQPCDPQTAEAGVSECIATLVQ